MLKNKVSVPSSQRWSTYILNVKYIIKQNSLLGSWRRIFEMKKILTLLYINRKAHNYYFNLPLNNQKTRSRAPIKHLNKWKFLTYRFVVQFCRFKKVKLSLNFILFDYINRLWHKQWYNEWSKIRNKRIQIRKITYKNRTNINFPILQYKHIIRNFKTMNKKKQKFLNHFNLGFSFFEYIKEGYKQKRFNRNVLKRKYSKFFVIKHRIQKYKPRTIS